MAVAKVHEIRATRTLSTSASVKASSLNGWSQLSSVNPSHTVLNLPLGLLNVNTAMVTSGVNRYSRPRVGTTQRGAEPFRRLGPGARGSSGRSARNASGAAAEALIQDPRYRGSG